MSTSHPWLGAVQPGTTVGRLKHGLATLRSGGTPDTGDSSFWSEDGLPWVAISDMSGCDLVSSSAKRITEAGLLDKRLVPLAPGTLLYSMYASLGHVAELGVRAVTNQAILGLTFRKGLYARYAFWQLKAIQPYVVETASSNTQDNLNAEKVRNLPFAFPPVTQQECIANFLDAQTARIDLLISAKKRLLEALVESAASQVLALVTGRAYGGTGDLSPAEPDESQLPPDWDLPQMARLVSKLTNGFVGPTRDILVPSGVRYLQSLHIKSGQIDFGRGEYFVDEGWSLAHAKSILEAGDIVIVQTGDIGQTALVTDDFVGCNCHALIIATPRRELVEPQYLEFVLRSAYGRASFDLYSTGALHPHLNCSNIRDIRIPLPPLGVQREIVESATLIEATHRRLRAHVSEHIERLREYRSSLISAAVTGQLDIGEFKEAA